MSKTDPISSPPNATLALNPSEWQALAITNANQLSHFLGTIPAQAGPTEATLLEIDGHLIRLRSFLQGWRRSAPPIPVEQPHPAQTTTAAAGSNGAAESKKGGWPKGKPRTRTPKPTQPAVQ